MKFLDSNVLAFAFYKNEYTEKCQNALREGGIVDVFNLVEAFFIIEKENTQNCQIMIFGLIGNPLRISNFPEIFDF